MDVALIQRLATKEAQDFIAEHESADENKLALKYKTLFGLPFALIAQQLVGRRKSKDKLPTWYNTKEVVFPPTINPRTVFVTSNCKVQGKLDSKSSI
jgi:hypothetical protein